MITLKQKQLARGRSYKAQKMGIIINPKICSECYSTKNIDGHHPDYRFPLKLIWLCRRCHMEKDGRMKALKEFNKLTAPMRTKPATPCKICGDKFKGLRRLRCHKCNEYFRRHNKERPPVKNIMKHNYELARKGNCPRCNRDINWAKKDPIHGFCNSCYRSMWNSFRRLSGC